MGSAGVQGALWGAAAEDWAELAEPLQVPFFEAALDAIGIGEGTRLLDAGCGSGLALMLASNLGAVVSGLDASAGLLAVARERLPGADLREGDLEALPFSDGSFDAVTAFNSMQYASDPTAALREVRRVAVPGAPVAITTWGAPEQCEMRAVLGAIGSLLPPPPPGAGGRTRRPRRGSWPDRRANHRRTHAVHTRGRRNRCQIAPRFRAGAKSDRESGTRGNPRSAFARVRDRAP
jgi:SAM-dependent methyltransferase